MRSSVTQHQWQQLLPSYSKSLQSAARRAKRPTRDGVAVICAIERRREGTLMQRLCVKRARVCC